MDDITSDEVDIELFSKLKLRVGKIISAESVPKSVKLYRLEVDLGVALGIRQVLSGIAEFYSAEELVGRKIVVLTNLKPRRVMGLESQGMLLAAAAADLSVLSLIEPARDLPEGSEVR